MAPPAAAEAASYFAGADSLASKDLVEMKEPAQRQELEGLRGRLDAPRELQGKTEAEALAFVKAQKARREKLQKEIQDLQKKRDAHLAAGKDTPDAFDERVVKSLQDRAAAAGIEY
jgi:hypothetical protein